MMTHLGSYQAAFLGCDFLLLLAAVNLIHDLAYLDMSILLQSPHHF